MILRSWQLGDVLPFVQVSNSYSILFADAEAAARTIHMILLIDTFTFY